MSVEKKQRAKSATTTPMQTDKSNFSRISVDLVVAICQFLGTHGIARLSRCCVLLRSRASLSLTGSPSPAFCALRNIKFALTRPGTLQLFGTVSLLTACTSKGLVADMRKVHDALLTAAYPASLLHLEINTELQLEPVLTALSRYPALESLRIRFGSTSWSTSRPQPKLPKLQMVDFVSTRSWHIAQVEAKAVLSILGGAPDLCVVRLQKIMVNCDDVLKALESAKLTELALRHMGNSYSPCSLTPIQNMTSLKKLVLAYSGNVQEQRLSHFPRSLTSLECAVGIFTIPYPPDVVLPELKELRLVCHGRDSETLFMQATQAVSKWCIGLQKLSFGCDGYPRCNQEHPQDEFIDVLALIAEGAFPKLTLFHVKFQLQGGLTSQERKIGKLIKTIKAKRPAFVFQPGNVFNSSNDWLM